MCTVVRADTDMRARARLYALVCMAWMRGVARHAQGRAHASINTCMHAGTPANKHMITMRVDMCISMLSPNVGGTEGASAKVMIQPRARRSREKEKVHPSVRAHGMTYMGVPLGR